ncbi:MAG TPA: TonB-dependent receptor [Terriglobales bacterium]|nr:TonB-dependent receptor [Terriglobales bacterium]
MSRLITALFVTVVVLTMPGAGGAQPAEPPRLAPVVVTPSRIEQRTSDVPASVTVVPGETIRNAPQQTVDDLLRQVPSFSLFRRSSSLVTHPTAQGVSLRGIGPSGASRALVLHDGVPINDPFGGWVQWGRLPLLGIEQIEVVRGGGSALWGNGALGGVIHVIPRRPTGRSFTFETSYGSLDTKRFDLFATEALGPLRMSAEGALFSTDGYTLVKESRRGRIDRPADSEHGVGTGRVEFHATPDLTLFATGTYFGEDRNNGTDLQENETALGSFATGGTVRTVDGSLWRLTISGQSERFLSTFSTQALDRNSETLALRQRSPSRTAGAALTWNREFGAHGLLAGFDSRWVQGETDEDVFVANRFTRNRVAGGEQLFAGAFVQDAWKIAPWLEVTGALRGDWWRSFAGFRKETAPPAGVPARQQFDEVDYVIASPKLAALVHVTAATDLFASVYQGFRVPTLNELYRQFRVRNDVTAANEKLRPERLTGGEAGVEQRWAAMDVRVTGFWNEVQDQILNVTLARALPDCPAGTTCRQRQNVELARIRGVETEVEVRPLRRWRLTAAHVYVDAHVVEAPNQRALEGNRLAQVPDHVMTFGVHWDDPAWLAASLLVRRVGGQFEDDLNTLPMGAYTTLDARISRQLGRNVQLYLAVENLLDETYTVARTSEGVVSIGAPRIIHGGVRLAF